MIDYKEIFKRLSENVDDEFEDESDIDNEIEDESDVDSEIDIDETNEDDEILLGSVVKVIDSTSYTAEDLNLTDDEFEEFQSKVKNGLTAIVFDVDNNDENLIDIVFEDGLEIFNISKINLELSEYVGEIDLNKEDEEFEDDLNIDEEDEDDL